jgi:DNA-binding winged helix-turn-helix (wHTH) protein/TolB-like protein
MSVDVAPVYRFGRFELDPDRRLLSAEQQAVPIGARAFDILIVLVRNRDRVVTKDEILETVWRGTVVEENNLAVHVSALRRALGERASGDRFIATVPGSGYRFVAPVVEWTDPGDAYRTELAPVGLAGSDWAATAGPDPPPTPPPGALSGPVPTLSRWNARRVRFGLMAVGLLSVVVVIGGILAGIPTGLAPRLSIAVLPFRSLGDGRRTYFADAVTDDLTTELAHIPRSIVLARGSADALEKSGDQATQIGRTLHVRYLLSGSILDEGPTLHVNAQLIETRGGANLWTDAFDVTRGDLAGNLSDIVGHVSNAVSRTLVQEEVKRSLRERPANPDALDLYLRAKSTLDETNDLSGMVEAQNLLEQSLKADPDATDVLAELGSLLVRKFAEHEYSTSDADFARARTVIERAVALQPEDVPSLIARGMLAWYEYRSTQADADFRLALLRNPSSIEAHWGLAHIAHDRGDIATMMSELKEILRIDPLSAKRDQCEQMLGRGYLILGKPAEALSWFELADSFDKFSDRPETPLDWRDWRRIFTIAATYLSGDTGRASELYRDYDRRSPNRTVALLASWDTRALSALPGNKAYLEALTKTGMPVFASEERDYAVAAPSAPVAGSLFDPTPLSIPGARRITTDELAAFLTSSDKPVILDFSTGSRMVPGAVLMPQEQTVAALVETLDRLGVGSTASHRARIVSMGEGPFGWDSYNAALRLVSLGYHQVFWYRGGEEAWTAHGRPSEDRRLN